MERYVYRLDGADTIRFVSPEWLRFAIENDAQELSEERVLGHRIWDFVGGVEVRRLYATLFASVRSRKSALVVPFRCDSPATIRFMELVLRPLADAGVELEGRLLRQERREPVALLSRRLARSNAAIPICSLCRRVFAENAWLDVGIAIARTRLFDGQAPPRLEETACPDCRSARG